MWRIFNIKEYCKQFEKQWEAFSWEEESEYNNGPPVSANIPNPTDEGPVIHIQLYNREELFKDKDEIIRKLSDGLIIRETIDELEVIGWDIDAGR